jgi:hypothetical protein
MLQAADGESWPELRVERRIAPRDSVPRGFGGLRACFDLPEGRLLLERERAAVTTVTEQPLPEDLLVHPWLTLAGGLWARWLGRDAFHGGAFLAGGGAWAILAQREQGKSTLLAWLAVHGRPVVSDDLLVIEDEQLFAGPRCVDVRPAASEWLGKLDLPLARGQSRCRLALEPVAAQAPLRGIVHLEWGEELSVAKVPLAQRIERLRPHNNFVGVPAGKATLLRLAALPTFELRRPRRLQELGAGAEALLAALPC